MAYTKNYYDILGLARPPHAQPLSTVTLRRAYRLALLGAHPDKQHQTQTRTQTRTAKDKGNGNGNGNGKGYEEEEGNGQGEATSERQDTKGVKSDGVESGFPATVYTVDDVKEAYTVLSDTKSRVEYEGWFLKYGGRISTASTTAGVGEDGAGARFSSDFILGLEVLDLGELDVVEGGGGGQGYAEGGGGRGGRGQMEWARGCRCGAEKGFRILEEELEDAERRGEKEVLVGCDGCSLWVRVGFDVEEG
ncbi:hypothetical protein T440DRAFT_514574 [Plenodomus tracheiphilus IPT5]|uniref:Diphthamide biosynthesis protein 4 n=1 Tax=Plenodomus tracheiphilus IPT5 TaxID=1408161 RepID=A0A6A7BIU4_9PLEO|nr:hypothetical protein T440DRAFT_514574 [Plenodomus tracheiphilus IPT5]